MSITIKDIAKLANVSSATVSKVINQKTHDISDSTRKKVEEILVQENYVPNQLARSIRTNVSKTIGLVIPDIRNSFFTDLARGAEDESYENGYSIFFANSDDKLDKEMKIINSMVANRVDGILIAGSTERDAKLEGALPVKTPAVSLDRVNNYKFNISTITTNNDEGAYNAVSYLIEKGHTKILHLAGPEDNEVSIARLNGFVEAHIRNNLSFSIDDVMFGDFSTASGYDQIINFDRIKDYTAIFASNDMIALGALSALNELNIKVPDDISLMGIDDIEYARLSYPALTTMDQPSYQLGRESARLLIDHLQGKEVPKQKILKQDLIVRKSVKAIK